MPLSKPNIEQEQEEQEDFAVGQEVQRSGQGDTTPKHQEQKTSTLQLEDISYSQDEAVLKPEAVIVQFQENHQVVPE